MAPRRSAEPRAARAAGRSGCVRGHAPPAEHQVCAGADDCEQEAARRARAGAAREALRGAARHGGGSAAPPGVSKKSSSAGAELTLPQEFLNYRPRALQRDALHVEREAARTAELLAAAGASRAAVHELRQ